MQSWEAVCMLAWTLEAAGGTHVRTHTPPVMKADLKGGAVTYPSKSLNYTSMLNSRWYPVEHYVTGAARFLPPATHIGYHL